MKHEILANLDNPAQLEKLYRTDKPAFKRAFVALSPELDNHTLAAFWNARLQFPKDDLSWGSRTHLVFVLLGCVVAGLIAKLPALFRIDETFFFTRNAGFILVPVLCAYFVWRNKLSNARIASITGSLLVGLVFINVLPDVKQSDTLILSCIHLLLFLWSVLGFAFVGDKPNSVEKRLGYLRYNGDALVMTTLIVIAGGILTGVTIGLFSLIGLRIEDFYFENIVLFAAPGAAILGTYLTQTNPQLVGKVSPVIARLFSPVILVMLIVYLVAMLYAGKDPYNDREFLLIFNALLVGVMAIIFFSVAESSKGGISRAEILILTLLSVVTIIVNGIALSAIVFRISSWGLTPNRAAVLGGNLLILVNLLSVTVQLFKVRLREANLTGVGRSIAYFLPIYCLWAIVVTFVFPLIFGFR